MLVANTIELQIATIVFAFTAVSIPGSKEEIPFGFSILISIGLIALVLSVAFGLVNEWAKKRFWNKLTRVKSRGAIEYFKVLLKKTTLEEAMAHAKGLIRNEDEANPSSPDWPLILQTAFLIIGGLTILSAKLLSIF